MPEKALEMKKDEEMRDTLIAISVIAKRLAEKIQQKMVQQMIKDLLDNDEETEETAHE